LAVLLALTERSSHKQDPESRIDALMCAYEGAVPGASVLVIQESIPIFRRAYGLADVERRVTATPTSNYRLASITKQFTAAAILLLAEDGRLTLDDPVRKWLPTLPDAANGIVIRHLLTHTSGLIDYEDAIPDGTTAQLHDADVLHLLEAQNRTYFPPGTDFRYSNSGYSFLALLVERASSKDFASFLHERVFKPLGMRTTVAYQKSISTIPDRAYGYSAQNQSWLRTDQSLTSAVLGDGGIYSSINDLAEWDAALHDNRLLRPESLRLAFTPATSTDDPAVQYSFGWRITGETMWHSGETLGFRNVIVRYPQRHFTVIVLTNRNEPEAYPVALAIANVFVPGANKLQAVGSVAGPDSGARPLADRRR
jgi:CubicO group peptidase (beta-lactamase class C family)